MRDEIVCKGCGAANRPSATWCHRCYAPFDPATPEPAIVRATEPSVRTQEPAKASSPTVVSRLVGWPFILFIVVLSATRVVAFVGGDPVEGAVDPRGFKFVHVDADSGEPVRFDPCAPIHYVINPALAPDQAIEDVHKAFEMTAVATGIRFVYDGITDEPVGSRDRAPYQPERYGERWAPVLVGWMTELPDDGEPGSDAGENVGLGGAHSIRRMGGPAVSVTGEAVFDADADLLPGFGGATWGQVILHELGHVLGLDHIDDETSIMYPAVGRRPASWGAGDRAGLWELGVGSECLQVPEPR